MDNSDNVVGVGVLAQQYNLKWTNHTNNILHVFAENLLKESLVDVTLSCEGYYIKAHKMILSACSLYFQEIFQVHTVDHPLIIMNGISFNILKQIIEFMYRGEIKVVDTDLESLLTLAENLQVKGLCNVRGKSQNSDGKKSTENATGDDATSNSGDDEEKTNRKRKNSPSPVVQDIISEGDTINGTDTSKSDTIDTKCIPTLSEMLKEEREKDKRLGLKQPDSSKKFKSNKNDQGTDTVVSSLITVSPGNLVVDDTTRKSPEKISSRIPRPPNAFMIFANEWRKRLATEHPGESNKDISVRLGTMWKSLSNETKDAYYEAAKKADEEHKVKYPGYYYSPKEARLRKAFKPPTTYHRKTPKVLEAMQLVRLILPKSSILRTGEEQEDDVQAVGSPPNVDVTANNDSELPGKQEPDLVLQVSAKQEADDNTESQ